MCFTVHCRKVDSTVLWRGSYFIPWGGGAGAVEGNPPKYEWKQLQSESCKMWQFLDAITAPWLRNMQGRFLIMCPSTSTESSDFRVLARLSKGFLWTFVFVGSEISPLDNRGLIWLCLSSNRHCMMCLGGPQRVFIPSNLSTQNMIACSGGNQVGCFFQPEGILWEQWNSACCLTLGSSMIERFAAGLRLAEMWRGSISRRSRRLTRPRNLDALGPPLGFHYYRCKKDLLNHLGLQHYHIGASSGIPLLMDVFLRFLVYWSAPFLKYLCWWFRRTP